MSIGHGITRSINAALAMSGFQVSRAPNADKPWDHQFRAWIADAKVRGVDPNDATSWSETNLKRGMELYYLKGITPGATVLELGPGTGRLTRHLIGKCGRLIVADYSKYVCTWMSEYLSGKGTHDVLLLESPALPSVANASVDSAVAHGVFEHIYTEDTYAYLLEFNRVIKPGGLVSFNFNNLASTGGIKWLEQHRPAAGQRCIFRFYHPEALGCLARNAGFAVTGLTVDDGRMGFIQMRRN